jgi:hypothetical protein
MVFGTGASNLAVTKATGVAEGFVAQEGTQSLDPNVNMFAPVCLFLNI